MCQLELQPSQHTLVVYQKAERECNVWKLISNTSSCLIGWPATATDTSFTALLSTRFGWYYLLSFTCTLLVYLNFLFSHELN